nr:MAG TPA: hypothetical protein [Caudoviricetes sp.]
MSLLTVTPNVTPKPKSTRKGTKKAARRPPNNHIHQNTPLMAF